MRNFKVVQPENYTKRRILRECDVYLIYFMIYSTFGVVLAAAGVSSVFVAGPVCVIGTTRSVFTGVGGLRGAVIVNTPSDDNDD